jgi:3alpha(or 20beta)-hydroxysteroid dehydrogenase
MGRLDGKTALITGGARGQGAAHAALFAREGASIVIGDVLDDPGEATAAQVRAAGSGALFVHLDVTDPDSCAAAVRTAEERFGHLDVLINNAGVVAYSGVADCSDAEWDALIGTNQTGVFNGMRAAIPALRRAGGGSIVNITSVTGGVRGARDYLGYAAAKAAVVAMTRSAALSYGEDNIRVNAIAPGAVRTPMTDQEVRDLGEHLVSEMVAQQALKRVAEPIDVSYGVLFLASDEASFITGITLTIDGGWSI